MSLIDFVVTWVDSSDPKWKKEKEKYEPGIVDTGNSENRYRDWGLMRYWFRSIQAYAPWVHKIYFITCGQVPEWLNVSNDKLIVIKHSDFMPSTALPTFNSNAIEMSLYRIESLSEHFVLFNDDMFLISKTSPSDFFKNGLPCDEALLDAVASNDPSDVFTHTLLNNSEVINKYFDKHDVLKRHRQVFFNAKYDSASLIRNALLSPLKYFSCFRDLHLPTSHLKSTYNVIKEKEPQLLEKTIDNKFRSKDDITHWILKNWRECSGNICPRSTKWGIHLELGVDDKKIKKVITNSSYKAVCINDSDNSIDFEIEKSQLLNVFRAKFPEKSQYEKY